MKKTMLLLVLALSACAAEPPAPDAATGPYDVLVAACGAPPNLSSAVAYYRGPLSPQDPHAVVAWLWNVAFDADEAYVNWHDCATSVR